MSTAGAPIPIPIAQAERIDSLDVLRGFALLGILLMNIQMFAMPYSAYVNPTSYGDFTGANYAVWFFCRIFADQKFMTIFSMLFGAGVIVFTTRAQQRGGSPARLHYSRSFWLLVLGLMHAYLLWPGDILVSYAVCALLVYPFRKLSPAALLVIGLIVVSIGSALTLMASIAMPAWPPEEIANELAAYRGGWAEQQPYRAQVSLESHLFDLWTWAVWRAGGLMLVGMALYKWDIFSTARSRRFYAKMVWLGLLFGVPVTYWGIRMTEAAQWDALFVQFEGGQFNYWGSLGVSSAYVGLLMLFCQSGGVAKARAALRGPDGVHQLPDALHHLHHDFLRARLRLLRTLQPRPAVADRRGRVDRPAHLFTAVARAFPVRSVRVAVALAHLLEAPAHAPSIGAVARC